MARKIRAKLIMELREQGLSRRMIAKTRRMSMESVCEVFDIAAERNIGWGDVREMADDEVYRLFYPERHVRESAFEEPDWEYVHKEMARVGVNLRLLHDEYRERCRRTGKVAMGYTKFCGDYGGWTVANSLTKRIEHKAGQSCEVDWSGPTLGRGLVDPITGELEPADPHGAGGVCQYQEEPTLCQPVAIHPDESNQYHEGPTLSHPRA